MNQENICPICGCKMGLGCREWHLTCESCKYEKADLLLAVNSEDAHQTISEDCRESGLRSLRINNFNLLVKIILEYKGGGRLLDVGCAHGWFLEAASSKFTVFGIEPDNNIAMEASKLNFPVYRGFFPNAINENEQFDVIIFNDVFEHLPNIDEALKACRKHLFPNGLLILNLPSSSGLFYKISRILTNFGMNAFFERMWQKGFPSPHLHYFNKKNLAELLDSREFEVLKTGKLDSVSLKGLYSRISYAGKIPSFIKKSIFLMIVTFIPLIKIMPSDIVYVISRKK